MRRCPHVVLVDQYRQTCGSESSDVDVVVSQSTACYWHPQPLVSPTMWLHLRSSTTSTAHTHTHPHTPLAQHVGFAGPCISCRFPITRHDTGARRGWQRQRRRRAFAG